MRPSQGEVDDDLDNAIDGGYTELLSWPHDKVAADMISYSACCHGATVEELAPMVADYMDRRARRVVKYHKTAEVK